MIEVCQKCRPIVSVIYERIAQIRNSLQAQFEILDNKNKNHIKQMQSKNQFINRQLQNKINQFASLQLYKQEIQKVKDKYYYQICLLKTQNSKIQETLNRLKHQSFTRLTFSIEANKRSFKEQQTLYHSMNQVVETPRNIEQQRYSKQKYFPRKFIQVKNEEDRLMLTSMKQMNNQSAMSTHDNDQHTINTINSNKFLRMQRCVPRLITSDSQNRNSKMTTKKCLSSKKFPTCLQFLSPQRRQQLSPRVNGRPFIPTPNLLPRSDGKIQASIYRKHYNKHFYQIKKDDQYGFQQNNCMQTTREKTIEK